MEPTTFDQGLHQGDPHLVRAHLDAGRPLLGIRTASHAFGAKPKDDAHEVWMTFDQDVLGGSYKNHYGNVPAIISLATGAATHPVLVGVDLAQLADERLYRNATLSPSATPLLMGRSQGEKPDDHVAWVNQVGKSRVFCTSLGAPADFQKADSRRLLTNAVFEALDRPAPTKYGQAFLGARTSVCAALIGFLHRWTPMFTSLRRLKSAPPAR